MLSPSFHKGAAPHTHFLPALRALGRKGNLLGSELVFCAPPPGTEKGLLLSPVNSSGNGDCHTVSGSRFKARQGLLPRSLVDSGVSVLFSANTPHLFLGL